MGASKIRVMLLVVVVAAEDAIRLVVVVVEVKVEEVELRVVEGMVKTDVSSLLPTIFFSESRSASEVVFSVAIRSNIFSTLSCSALRSFS